jgi:AcrR family transcriptional regulator
MSAGRSSGTGSRRRRRTPEVAEREIIDAAEELLRERPFRELTVDEVMRRTELSRPSLYVYFRDRHHLVLRLVERLHAETAEIAGHWYQGNGPGEVLIREALAGIAAVFERDGAVLHALSDAAADDPDVEIAHEAIISSFIEATARHIEAEIEAGNMLPLDAWETARALTLMNERYLVTALGRAPTVAPEVVVETLATIWTRTLYGAH